MSLNSGVQWCHHSHGFWRGCKKVSPGCAKCYAERDMNRWNPGSFNTITRSKSFDAPLKWLRSGKAKPGERVFVCPNSDFFIKEADQWRAEALYIMHQAIDLNFLILTKRIERMAEKFPRLFDPKIFPNVWLIVSVENQEQADKRIRLLMQCEAAIRGVSFEPLLEAINLPKPSLLKYGVKCGIDWAIIGGESDYKDPRPMNPEWAVDLVYQLKEWGIPVFFKQMGGSNKIGGHWGGNQLEGETYEEFPKVPQRGQNEFIL